jgi:predicted enzyme related to lactoylglutathione lyase
MKGATGNCNENETEETTMTTKGFFWYELMTSDAEAAEAFYAKVVGWSAAPFGGDSGMPYTVLSAGERGVGGIMEMPEGYRKGGGHPAWVGYVHTPDIDTAVEKLEKAGGKVHRSPEDIPDVGRFAVVSDPQGALFQFLQPNGPDQPPVPANTPGHIGWHELYTSDWKKAIEFYSSQFGWKKTREFDMGEMGIYAIFAMDEADAGGMMDKPPQMPSSAWQFYFNVPAVDAAASRVTEGGGKVLMGPMEVPGGQWVAQCQDPQGAHFALVARGR